MKSSAERLATSDLGATGLKLMFLEQDHLEGLYKVTADAILKAISREDKECNDP